MALTDALISPIDTSLNLSSILNRWIPVTIVPIPKFSNSAALLNSSHPITLAFSGLRLIEGGTVLKRLRFSTKSFIDSSILFIDRTGPFWTLLSPLFIVFVGLKCINELHFLKLFFTSLLQTVSYFTN